MTNPKPTITLRELTKGNYESVLRLKVKESQTCFVATNTESIAEAHFEPAAWFRGIFADDTAVGFVMLADKPEETEYHLWRYMIGDEFQRLGYGRDALQLVIAHVRTRPGATEFLLSFVDGKGSPEAFYASLGFERTGDMDGDETVMRLTLADPSEEPE